MRVKSEFKEYYLGMIRIASDVAKALAANAPVVALESTIISHGMPYPDNVKTAREVEAIIREAGATPATIAIIEGVPHIGGWHPIPI
jgi:pseudouridylate synthase